MSDAQEEKAVRAAFGAVNRNKLISEFLARPEYAGEPLWKTVYRLLLWVDATTGLGHCYESDKSQPGKNWYPRALAFHGWLSMQFCVDPSKVVDEIDHLFRTATEQLVKYVLSQKAKVLQKAAGQRAKFTGRNFPEPGDDPELVSIVQEVLGANFATEPTAEQWKLLVERVRQYVTLENKRKNLVGEGFEDVLAAVGRKALGAAGYDVNPRKVLQTIPGFENKDVGEKTNRVDLVITREQDHRRVLVTAKWSIRADREKQFPQEHQSYVRANSVNRPWQFVLITNEFDPARLMRACDGFQGNNYMFEKVVHINPEGVLAAYGEGAEATMAKVRRYVEEGRLVSMSDWLEGLAAA